MPPQKARSPADAITEISQTKAKIKPKRQTLTQRCNSLEDVMRRYEADIERNQDRIEGLAEIQTRTLAEVKLLKLQQTDHADRVQLEAVQSRLYQLERTNAAAHGWIKTQLQNQSTGTTIAAAVMVSTMITLVIVAISTPTPRQQQPQRPIQPQRTTQPQRHDVPTIKAGA